MKITKLALTITLGALALLPVLPASAQSGKTPVAGRFVPTPSGLLLPAVQQAVANNGEALAVLQHELGHALGIQVFLEIFTDGFESGDAKSFSLNFTEVEWRILSGRADFSDEEWLALWSSETFRALSSEETRVYIDDIIIGILPYLEQDGVWDDADIVH